MKSLLALNIFATTLFALCSSQVFQNNFNNLNNINNANRQAGGNRVGGLSFAIPGLSLLAGGNGGGNLFGPATVTRTVVSTVSTVTTASFRTCVAPTAALMPCVAGRRRRGAEDPNFGKYERIEPTPVIQLILGPTTIRDARAVEDFLEAHKPCTQSLIFPPDVQPFDTNAVSSLNAPAPLELEPTEIGTTPLYASQDTPDSVDADNETVFDEEADGLVTTETPNLSFDENADGTTASSNEVEVGDIDRARVGLGKTSTVTTVIRVTSVATSLATGTMATLTISYAGCLPPSLPISAPACAP